MLATCASIILNFHLSTFNCAQAQDIHFSMFDLDPLLFNPAYSGFFDATARFGAVYRNQWASVSTPFQTFSATAEVAIARSAMHRNGFNAGLWVSNDRAGTLGYGSTTASAIVSYFQGIGDGSNIVSVGLEGGLGQVGFSTDGIVMTDGTESFNRTKVIYPTLGAGVVFYEPTTDVLYTKAATSTSTAAPNGGSSATGACCRWWATSDSATSTRWSTAATCAGMSTKTRAATWPSAPAS